MDLKPAEKKSHHVGVLVEPSTAEALKRISELQKWASVSDMARVILKQYIENVKAAEAAGNK